MLAVLRDPAFLRFFLSAFITRAGNQVQRIALFVLVYELTGSTAALASVFSAQLVVNIFLGPLLAAWVEGQEKSRLFVLTQVIQGVLVLFIPTLAELSLFFLWLLVFIVHIFQTMEYPLIATMTPELAPRERLDEANALLSFAGRFSEVAVVGLAGLLVAAVGPVPAFYINAASFFVAAALLLGLPLIPAGKRREVSYFEHIKEGFSFLWRHRFLRLAIGALFVAALLGSVENVLGVALAIGVLEVGSAGYGVMEMALALGAVLGAVWAPSWIRRLGREMVFALSLFLFGLGIASVGAWPWFYWAVLAYFVSGVFNQGFLIPLSSILQLESPRELRARVFGAVGAVADTAILAGILWGGLVADLIGVLPTYLIAGVGVSLVGLYLLFRFTRGARPS